MLQGCRVKYYKARDLEPLMFESGGEIKNAYDSDPNVLFFFDAIDEINSDKKAKIKDKISTWPGHIIMTARVSEYSEKNTGFVTFSLKPMDAKKFLISRFHEDNDNLQRLRKILLQNDLDQEVEGNPLLLTMITLLAKLGEDGLNSYLKLKIQPLEEIKNR